MDPAPQPKLTGATFSICSEYGVWTKYLVDSGGGVWEMVRVVRYGMGVPSITLRPVVIHIPNPARSSSI